MLSFLGSVFTTLFGCQLNNVELEFMISKKLPVEWTDQKAAGLLTLLQFSFIALVGLPQMLTLQGCTIVRRKPTVPVWEYLKLSALFSVMSFLNNLAFAFNISQPMHMVFRSSNLLVSYVYAWMFRGQKHDPVKLLSVLLLTLGAAVATLAESQLGDTAKEVAKLSCPGCASGSSTPSLLDDPAAAAQAHANLADAGQQYFITWCLGIAILCAVLCLQTVLGAMQEDVGKLHGRAPFEAMFYMHALSIPALCYLAKDNLGPSWNKWSASPRADGVITQLIVSAQPWGLSWLVGTSFLWFSTLSLAYTGFVPSSIPVLWLHAGLNVVTQWLCLTGVYSLISQADQLTVNVVLTVRKFVSLMTSIYLFGNTFTGYHWCGAVLVFVGASLYGMGPQVHAWLASQPPTSPALADSTKSSKAVSSSTASQAAAARGVGVGTVELPSPQAQAKGMARRRKA